MRMVAGVRAFAAGCALALLVSGCATQRETNGAVLGGAAGAVVGGVATNSVGGALVGGAVGAVAGAAIAGATAPHYYHRHCWWNGYGQRVCRYY